MKSAEKYGYKVQVSELGLLLLTWFNFNPRMDK